MQRVTSQSAAAAAVSGGRLHAGERPRGGEGKGENRTEAARWRLRNLRALGTAGIPSDPFPPSQSRPDPSKRAPPAEEYQYHAFTRSASPTSTRERRFDSLTLQPAENDLKV